MLFFCQKKDIVVFVIYSGLLMDESTSFGAFINMKSLQ